MIVDKLQSVLPQAVSYINIDPDWRYTTLALSSQEFVSFHFWKESDSCRQKFKFTWIAIDVNYSNKTLTTRAYLEVM